MTQQFVTIAEFQFLPEAEICKLTLQSQGFAAVLTDAELVSTNWFLGNAVGYIKLQVPTEQTQAAATCLQQNREELRQKKLANDSATETCLACGVEMSPDETTCHACGWSYGTEQELKTEEDEL